MEIPLDELGLNQEAAMYVGDSITDVEPPQGTKGRGPRFPFNGNRFALREAEIAVISDDQGPPHAPTDLHSRFGRNT